MMFRYDFLISDLLLRVESPRQLTVPDNFRPFIHNEPPAREPDILLEIVFSGGIPPQDTPADETRIVEQFHWQDAEYIIRQEPVGRGDPCRLVIPPSFADIFCGQGKWLLYMALERLLMPFDRFVLHASAVIYQGKAYVFSAPSGGGKSTHAALWQEHFGAKLLNGDKVVIHARENQCAAFGSPIAGSSGIYENDGAPIAAVFLLRKGNRNKLTPIPRRGALLALYSEAIKCSSDPAFNIRLLDLIETLQKCVPVFSLECLPEKEAVDCILNDMEGMTQ